MRKVLVALSLVVTLGGLGLWGYAAVSQGGAAPSHAAAGPDGTPRAILPQGLVPLGPGEASPGEGTGAPSEPGQLEVWSPAIFRLGFSFFAGFCMAYALRAFMKITSVVIGVGLLALFGLQYAGLINVNWGAMEGVYDSVAAWMGQQTESFSQFVSGYLPSAASGVAGFAAGFTTRR